MDPLLVVPGWPFDDGRSQYRLVWDGGDSKLPLFAEPDPNSELLGELTYEDGQEISTAGDYVAIYRPALFRTKRKMTLEGTIYTRAGVRGGTFVRQLDRGDTVAVYLYAGDDRCYLGVGGRTIIGRCPTPDDYIGVFKGPTLAYQMQPTDKLWWVRISTPAKSGWTPLDDRVFADIFPIDAPPPDTSAVAAQEAQEAQEVEVSPTVPSPTEAELNREAEMFGASDTAMVDEAPTDVGAPESAEIDAGLGAPILNEEEIAQRLDAQDDPLTVGAFAFLQLHYYALEEGDPTDFTVASPSLLDLYLDARPNPRVRAYARGRLTANLNQPTSLADDGEDPASPFSVDLDQLWINFDVARAMYVTAGKQHVKWGTGRFWNPTDFLSDQPRDPLELALFDRRLGVTLLKLHFPLETLSSNVYAIAVLDDVATVEDVGAALRAETLVGLTEIAISGTARREQPYRAGLDISTGVWWFDLHFEGALLYEDPRPYYRGLIDPPRYLPVESSREDMLLPQAVWGAELQIPYRRGDLLVLGGEYFYNGTGYADESLYPWLFYNDRYIPFYAGRRYAGGYAALQSPGSWDDTTFFATGLANLSDESFIARLDITQTALAHLRWNVFANYHFGNTGELNYGLEIEPNVFVPEGIDITPPLFEAGIGIQMDL